MTALEVTPEIEAILFDPFVEEVFLRKDLAYFAENVLHMEIVDHHKDWSRLCATHRRICINAARDHGKSYFWCFAYAIWRAYYHWVPPAIREGFRSIPKTSLGYIFSNTQDQAIKHLTLIKEEILTNPKLAHLIPPGKGASGPAGWSQKEIKLQNGATIRAFGWGSSVRGAHPGWIICDDVLNDESIYSEMVRRKQKDYFFSAVTPMLIPGGQFAVVGCVKPDTWISTSFGLHKIGDLNPGDRQSQKLYDIDLSIHGRLKSHHAYKFWVNGVVPTKYITTECGFHIEGSHVHPLLVMEEYGVPGWKRSGEIEIGDYVALYCGSESWGEDIGLPNVEGSRRNSLDMPDVLSSDLAYLVGLWTAEGSYESTGRVMISNTDEEIRQWLLSSPFGMNFKINDNCPWTLRCSAYGFLEIIKYLGGILGTAKDKIVPSRIMSAPRDIAKSFLQGLFDGDGCAWAKGVNKQVMLGTISEQLARDVHLLLLNFGIIASLRKRPIPHETERAKGKYPLWTVTMCGNEAYKYAKEIGFRLTRKQSIIKNDCDKESQWRGIPYQKSHIMQAREDKPRCKRNSGQSIPPINISEICNVKRPSRKSLKAVVEWFESQDGFGLGTESLKSNLDEDKLIWLKVTKIEDRKSMTMDFVTDGDHSFISNGIISHNTPFHADDLYNDIRENKEYVFERYPALDESGKPLWPTRYSKDILDAKLREVGSVRFSREYLTVPVSDESSLFPERMLRACFNQDFTMPNHLTQKDLDQLQIFTGVDLALSATVGADFTVITTVATDRYQNIWILDIKRSKGKGMTEQLRMIEAVYNSFRPNRIYIEDNSFQRVFRDELIKNTSMPVMGFTTGTNKNSLEKGVPSLQILFENRKFQIPRATERDREITDVLVNELKMFSWVDGKLQGVGSHDDCVMSLWIATEAARNSTFSFAFA